VSSNEVSEERKSKLHLCNESRDRSYELPTDLATIASHLPDLRDGNCAPERSSHLSCWLICDQNTRLSFKDA
jgi:hypothetical protein